MQAFAAAPPPAGWIEALIIAARVSTLLELAGFEAPRVRVFWIADPRTTPAPFTVAELACRFEETERAGDDSVLGRFLVEPGQRLSRRAATLIAVQEADEPRFLPFLGPSALW